MEHEPLLPQNEQVDQRRRLFSNPSYDQLPQAAASCYGDNYIIPPGRQEDDTSEEEQRIYTVDHWPVFIYIVSLVNIALVIYLCVTGGIERVSFTSPWVERTVAQFGSINSSHSNISKKVSIQYGANVFIGPNVSFLIHNGAGFTPCIRKDRKIVEELHNQMNRENISYRCCSLNEECGMQSEAQCTNSSHGTIVGGRGNCSSNQPNCSHGITLRPCCIGYYANCEVISEQECTIIGGYWNHDKLLCSEVNCLNDVCGMTGVKSREEANQWYRLITPIFLHLGVIHAVVNLLMQIPVGRMIEKEIGSVRIVAIYLISGVGGCLASSIFDPLSPQVGASGALFGLFASMFVLLFHKRGLTVSPCRDFIVLLVALVLSFVIGTLPYISNFVHLGGFAFGLVASVFLVPDAKFGRCRAIGPRCWCFLAVLSLATAFAGALLLLYEIADTEFCSWCHYFDCIPWTSDLCPNMYKNRGGLLDNSEKSMS